MTKKTNKAELTAQLAAQQAKYYQLLDKYNSLGEKYAKQQQEQQNSLELCSLYLDENKALRAKLKAYQSQFQWLDNWATEIPKQKIELLNWLSECTELYLVENAEVSADVNAARGFALMLRQLVCSFA